jgi:hypothetical protein
MGQRKRAAFRLSLLCFLAAAAGCSDDTKLEGAPVTLDAGGRSVELQLGDCRVYKVEHGWFGAVHKTRVLSTDFYLGFTVCTRQSLSKQGDYAIASLCRQAVGAGGGCASSGTYRSRNGDRWEKQVGDARWAPVDAGDAPQTAAPATDSAGKAAPKQPAKPDH